MIVKKTTLVKTLVAAGAMMMLPTPSNAFSHSSPAHNAFDRFMAITLGTVALAAAGGVGAYLPMRRSRKNKGDDLNL